MDKPILLIHYDYRARFSDVEIDLFFHFFQSDPAISQIILNEEQLKAQQVKYTKNIKDHLKMIFLKYNIFCY